MNNGGTSSHMNGSHGASNGYRQQSASADRYGQSHGSSSNGGMSRTEADRNDWLQRQQRKNITKIFYQKFGLKFFQE